MEWLRRHCRKRRLQTFEHGEMAHIEGCQLESLDVGGCCDEVVTESNTRVTEAISTHHFPCTTSDDLCDGFCAKRCQQPSHFATLD